MSVCNRSGDEENSNLQTMKISLITACYNAEKTICDALESVARQKGVVVESIVMDGGSTDGTVARIKAFAEKVRGSAALTVLWQSAHDQGMYDALNKGIARATGDVVGILNADDVLADETTLATIAAAFESDAVEAVYGDVRFVRELGGRTVRYCSARWFRPWMFRFAVMVPHPSFYCRRELFVRFGGYSLDYRICADFELVMRYLWKHRVRARYIPQCLVEMRLGGASTVGLGSTIEINREDLRALRANGYWSALSLIYLKYLFKIWGFVFRRDRGQGRGANHPKRLSDGC